MSKFSKRQILELLHRGELIQIARHAALEVRDQRVRAELIDAAVSSQDLSLEEILGTLSRDRLKELCRALALDDSGREKALLIDRLRALDAPAPSGRGSTGRAETGQHTQLVFIDPEPMGGAPLGTTQSAPAATAVSGSSVLAKRSDLLGIERLEADLWEAADQLRANSKLTSSEYCMPALGVIFLRHANNRYEAARRQIEADQAAGKMPKRLLVKADFLARRALLLPEEARFSVLLTNQGKKANLGAALRDAMDAIEAEFPPLHGLLPRDYDKLGNGLLEDLLRIFDREALRSASGDVFGRIYEYFLMKFAMQGAQDNGEFFTPPSLVQAIVNVIEPDHGVVFDPACGSGGMFVQTSHFIEDHGGDTARKVSFFGQEKTATTIRLAKMNLAVHGLEGDIREANTFYEDVHRLGNGKPLRDHCDFVMANPPFNVDMVDAEKAKADPRLTFGLPGVNTKNKVSNGNYLWISYFHSYLGPKGRAGFVMSSQASSAGHGEAKVRRKIVETGDMDVMLAIRSNFFYTRTVPCELWFFDKGKPAARRDQVLMLDARQVYRKVSRKIYDFSPEQLANLTAIVWLYRGESERFLGLVRDYFGRVCAEAARVPAAVQAFGTSLDALRTQLDGVAAAAAGLAALEPEQMEALKTTVGELKGTQRSYAEALALALRELAVFVGKHEVSLPATNEAQRAARRALESIAERLKGLTKQIDLLYKLGARVVQLTGEAAAADGGAVFVDRRGLARCLKQLDEERRQAVGQLKQVVYFERQIMWLEERFPDAVMAAVPGLCKVVTRKEIEAADWSLTPGRYVGVAPPAVDEDFDFEQALRDIHVELAELNAEAAELARKIQQNFEELGV
jgi:type I restriction enzyme M protein